MKKNKLIYCCENCHHLKIEPITLKQRIFYCCKLILGSLFILTSIIGLLAVFNFIQVNDMLNFKALTNLGSSYASVLNIQQMFQSKDEFIPIVQELTEDCTDDLCKTRAIYEELVKFEYVVGDNLDPSWVWENKQGDCDMISNLFVTMQLSQGIPSIMVCNENHCWVLTEINGKTYKIDIVNKIFEEVDG